ncbi:MAG: membrane dipeptidase [Rhodothermales bacterium]
MRLIFDAHLDLAWNAVSYNRDLTLTVGELRRREAHMTDVAGRGRCTTTLPELADAGVAVCVATLLARSGAAQTPQNGYKRTDLEHATPAIAHAAAQAQRAYYRLLEEDGLIRMLRTKSDLAAHWQAWETGATRVPGIILSMEGCDPMVRPEQAEAWWGDGLRAAGVTHYGLGRYAAGTGVAGPINERGLALLRVFERLGMALDVTHLSDEAMDQALDGYQGRVLASHHNCRALVPHQRQLPDAHIRRLIDRDAVIGAALDAWMLYPGWVRSETKPDVVGLEAVADHIERVCDLAGNARHAAIGSDLDGGFGTEQTPRDLDTIADLRKLEGILAARGFAPADIDAIFYGNWLRFFGEVLPD